MDEGRRQELAEEVHLRVWEGVDSSEEIVEILCDDPDLSDEEHEWIGQEVERVYAAKYEAEKSWPEVTDWDKLDAAFTALNRAGIIALHQAGFDISDGLDDVGEVYREREGVIGYCFYHSQDVHRAILGQGLMLAFGDMTDDEAKSEEIGRRIVAEIERAGFHVIWNGKKAQRIKIDNLRWQKRSS